MEYFKKVLKKADTTRWFARHDTCDRLYNNWNGVMKSLCTLEEYFTEKASVRYEAFGLKCQLDRFETIFMTIFLNLILKRFNSTSKKL